MDFKAFDTIDNVTAEIQDAEDEVPASDVPVPDSDEESNGGEWIVSRSVERHIRHGERYLEIFCSPVRGIAVSAETGIVIDFFYHSDGPQGYEYSSSGTQAWIWRQATSDQDEAYRSFETEAERDAYLDKLSEDERENVHTMSDFMDLYMDCMEEGEVWGDCSVLLRAENNKLRAENNKLRAEIKSLRDQLAYEKAFKNNLTNKYEVFYSQVYQKQADRNEKARKAYILKKQRLEQQAMQQQHEEENSDVDVTADHQELQELADDGHGYWDPPSRAKEGAMVSSSKDTSAVASSSKDTSAVARSSVSGKHYKKAAKETDGDMIPVGITNLQPSDMKPEPVFDEFGVREKDYEQVQVFGSRF